MHKPLYTAVGFALLLLICTATTEPAAAPMNAVEAMKIISNRFEAVAQVPDDPRGRFIYGTNRGVLHLLEWKDGRFFELWSSPFLGSRIVEVFIADVHGDGQLAIVAYTPRGIIAIYYLHDYSLVWKTPEEQFTSITRMVLANIDADAALELIFLSDGTLYQYDGRVHAEEWRSQTQFNDAQYIAVGDVDGDGQLEIVLNSGEVIDAQFGDVEWESPVKFGLRISLVDMDGDDVLEILAEQGNGSLRIFEADMREEKWER